MEPWSSPLLPLSVNYSVVPDSRQYAQEAAELVFLRRSLGSSREGRPQATRTSSLPVLFFLPYLHQPSANTASRVASRVTCFPRGQSRATLVVSSTARSPRPQSRAFAWAACGKRSLAGSSHEFLLGRGGPWAAAPLWLVRGARGIIGVCVGLTICSTVQGS